ncbi:DUF4190 domain-containing protein [Solirubrobacter phytolaccae]|uniref:DUF4190 domain-containing protein n=1 Tax=Solirubrobacter phytolaccae TaxID=1404360 RepID=A0A9X3SBI6_9ACTN|nr:DUF4190 domain-containing protein [Solirubrobacter phytolaccae]MDA0184728.1 DUF4190 domain-containing protein [Solirubrobacter phytolaccae]
MSGQGDDEQQQPPQWQQPQWQSQWQQPQQPEQQPPSDQSQWGQQPQWGHQQQGWQQPPQTPGSATAALILGICALVICSPICGPLAIIYGNKGKREIDASGGRLTGRGMAQAGVVMGWIGIALTVLGILAFVGLVALGASSS